MHGRIEILFLTLFVFFSTAIILSGSKLLDKVITARQIKEVKRLATEAKQSSGDNTYHIRRMKEGSQSYKFPESRILDSSALKLYETAAQNGIRLNVVVEHEGSFAFFNGDGSSIRLSAVKKSPVYTIIKSAVLTFTAGLLLAVYVYVKRIVNESNAETAGR